MGNLILVIGDDEDNQEILRDLLGGGWLRDDLGRSWRGENLYL
jgi:hypothetical protein